MATKDREFVCIATFCVVHTNRRKFDNSKRLFSAETSFVLSSDSNYVAYAQMPSCLLCSILNLVWTMQLTGMFLQFEHCVVVISAEKYAGHMTAAAALVLEV